MSYRLFMLAGN